jgi:hypothetical protein
MDNHPTILFGVSFDLAAVQILAAAFERASNVLSHEEGPATERLSAYEVRQVLARKVIETFSRGERDPEALAQEALKHLQRQHLNGALNQPLTGRIAAAGGGVEGAPSLPV